MPPNAIHALIDGELVLRTSSCVAPEKKSPGHWSLCWPGLGSLGLPGSFGCARPCPVRARSRVWTGLSAPVEILRDGHGIPHIFAQSTEDALFAVGYVHAQDRLWQMEGMRRLGAGRLAEAVGAPALKSDRFMRTLGLYRRAEEQYVYLAEDVRRALDAYAAGVNAWLLAHRGTLPPEFVLLGIEPEPWTAGGLPGVDQDHGAAAGDQPPQGNSPRAPGGSSRAPGRSTTSGPPTRPPTRRPSAIPRKPWAVRAWATSSINSRLGSGGHGLHPTPGLLREV